MINNHCSVNTCLKHDDDDEVWCHPVSSVSGTDLNLMMVRNVPPLQIRWDNHDVRCADQTGTMCPQRCRPWDMSLLLTWDHETSPDLGPWCSMISDDGSTDTDKPTLRLWIIVIIARSEVIVRWWCYYWYTGECLEQRGWVSSIKISITQSHWLE